ncbi:Uncharacterized protein TCM_015834 [Theobroma cacao]|uniref:Uncharacterized protein n=1 Tax=Theobroma cacao TaxID=3641 RepID=A0A061G2W0_THECC|nr:Uncharacterized protein TCM_015834 [Theobroma cacao]
MFMKSDSPYVDVYFNRPERFHLGYVSSSRSPSPDSERGLAAFIENQTVLLVTLMTEPVHQVMAVIECSGVARIHVFSRLRQEGLGRLCNRSVG